MGQHRIRRWLRDHWPPSAFAVFAVGTIAVNGLVGLLVIGEGRERDDEQDQARIERAIESCLAFNSDQTENRDFEVEQILEMGRIFFGTTPEDEVAMSSEIEQFRATIADALPYRQCSVACVEARTDALITDCPPSPSENGAPP